MQYDVNFTARIHASSPNLSKFTCVCLGPDGSTYVPATTANLAAAGGLVQGVLLDDTGPGGAASIQVSGTLLKAMGPGLVSAGTLAAVGPNSVGVLALGSSTPIARVDSFGNIAFNGGITSSVSVAANTSFLSTYGADFSATWATSQAAADIAWVRAQFAMSTGAIRTLIIDAGDVLAHSTTQFQVYPNCTVYGQLAGSNIHTSANAAVFEIFGDHAAIANLRITGDWNGINGSNAKTSQHAVSNGTVSYLNYFEDMSLHNIYAQNMSGDAFLFQGADTNLVTVWTSRISNCVVDTCQHAGFKVTYGAEYITMTGCHATYCTDAALYVAAGNFTAVGCTFTRSQTAGVELAAGFNNSHGSITGCRINHNYTGIQGDAITDGFLFSDCHIVGSLVNTIALTSSQGIRFANCHIGGGNFIFDGSTGTYFDDACHFDEGGGVMVVTDNANGHPSQTFWGDCKSLLDPTQSPASIRARRQIPGFTTDADHTLTLQEDTAVRIRIPVGLLTATRTLTSPRAPAAGVTPLLLSNPSSQSVVYKWSTGTGVTVTTGSHALIGSDGTNAIRLDS